MAAIVIRDVVVSLSTTKFSKTTVNTQRTHRRTSSSNLLCACLCDSTPTSSPYRLSAQRLLDSDNDTLDFRSSSTSTECSCENCPKSEYKFKSIETFSDDNISSSTAFEDSPVKKPNWPSFHSLKRYQDNSANLGVLKEIRSPIFAEDEEPKPSRGYSLRSQKPLYVKNLLIAQDSTYSAETETGTETKTANPKTDTVVNSTISGGINMNENKQRIIPATVTTITRGSVKSSNGTDINRNNGFARNGTIQTLTSTEKREHLYKILVIGELGTGKTSFIKRYVHQFFSQNYRATIGVDFALKVLHWDPNTIVRLQLWDIAGQERFGNMTRVYYKEAVGAFIVFDVTRSGTFDCVSKWKEDLDSKVQLPDGTPIPCILLANKCDQEKQGIVTTPDKMEDYVKENGFAGWFETSAKENINIDEAARALVNKILLNDKLISAADLADGDKFNLNSSGDQSAHEAKSKCSC
ncbi:ras and EF-hand domain-containing protein homolog isoform X2 [Glossina fuscipes]|uniref:Ras and EF-hand domain-containing protein homolog isoform X2 n=1 Tax=Glossina fuscipes TaxID=7396 RepID=A0A9C5ZG45_9MUSC|nr:ras and EF-hand domain-containing protein homolog isoform X2 [Glossina fuscipes]XP_037895885.1 ras and EF-hand domain-containing protein homolog isoform X2 [Glossina fuscipes]XP_037895886.1 ras and EF-hand domain-containing protein homolog isoform X2 [Glossina fuscipes]XP_037895887.1 ras and EF-hand domain-containing protein homolog isoform X2 [Glossina fuscipes]XP_037895888.1 ras and EF-hand domain-containing protein homolog isoform X2 [Glossina fuscipes]XP_037895889.1 ras and EF-hand doma